VLATLAARGRETALIDLRLVQLAQGEREALRDAGEMCAIVLSGTVDVTVGDSELSRATRSGDIFEASGDAVYVPPAETLTLAAQEDATVAVAAAPLSDRPAGGARLIAASEHEVRTVGIGNWSRAIRTILGSAGQLVVVSAAQTRPASSARRGGARGGLLLPLQADARFRRAAALRRQR
jgi:5-deoxy-D-glucuronate isomerase